MSLTVKPFNVGDKCFVTTDRNISEEMTVCKKYKNGNVILDGDTNRQQYDGNFGYATGDGYRRPILRHPDDIVLDRLRFDSMVRRFKDRLHLMGRKSITLGDRKEIATKIKAIETQLQGLKEHCK